ncbi:MAG: PEP-CTERM sorting domain-containing protein, partial [Planctomycetota bacterium]|nr:PEP-CTERM sorting domain-containing protein [Planctomycetota bacterium]
WFFDFVDLSPFHGPDDVPVSWGSRSLSPFTDFTDPTPFVMTVIAQPAGMAILDVNMEFGDFNPSDIDYITYDGTNTFLPAMDLSGGFVPTSGIFDSGTASAIDASQGFHFPLGRQVIVFGGGSDGQRQSLFWDNITLFAIASGDLPMGSVAPAVSDQSDPTNGAGGIPGTVGGPVPEPGTFVLLGAALAVAAYRRRRKTA